MNAHNVGGVLASRVYDSGVFTVNQTLVASPVLTGLLVMGPFTSSADLPVYQIGALVGVTFPANNFARLGIYKTGANGWPGDRIYDSGQIAISSAAFQSVLVSGLTLAQSEPYWLALTIGTAVGTTGQFWGPTIPINAPMGFINVGDTQACNVVAFPFTDVTQPLPATAPAVTSANLKSMAFPSVKIVSPA